MVDVNIFVSKLNHAYFTRQILKNSFCMAKYYTITSGT